MKKPARRKGASAASIHDVARRAGVSHMTVSRVLNESPRVVPATRAKVRAAMKALGYVPNQMARGLASAHSSHIGILFSNPSSAYLGELLAGSLIQARLAGIQLIIERCEGQADERAAIRRLLKGGANGLLLPAPHCESEAALKAVADAGVPAVLLASGRPTHCAVGINDFEAARAMTIYLSSLGHTRIGFINGPPTHYSSGQRFRGFIEGMTEAGLSVSSDQVGQGFYTYQSGLLAAERLLTGYRPTAIFASNDDMAAAAIAVAHRLGLDVPRDLAIAGFDDTPVASTIWPGLTTVHQPISDMAREAVRLLMEQMENRRRARPLQVRHKLLKFSIVTRDSTRAVATKKSLRAKDRKPGH